MAHGGTTFGLWSGADRPFKPDTSSYDYDAPISEAGWPTEKFARTRALMTRYLAPGEMLPDPPARNPVIAVAATRAGERAPLLNNLPEPVHDAFPHTMEHYDQGFGAILYRTTLPAGPAATLEAAAVHDLGIVHLDGRRVGVMDRRHRSFRLRLPERKVPAVLDVLVEAMGRVNFGPEVHDRKGLHGPVRVGEEVLSGWDVYRFPLDAAPPTGLDFKAPGPDPGGVAFWRAALDVPEPGDTFLDMSRWGKGIAWVNGHCLGRFWNIGPTQTMYVPGPWLRSGRNEIVILDLLGPSEPVVRGLKEPVLDRLRPELDPSRRGRTAPDRAVVGVTALEGRFAPGTDVQVVRFSRPVRGRYVALESLSAHDGKPYAAAAELSLLDPDGEPLDQGAWSIAGVDSEELSREDGSAGNALDGQAATFWHTQWADASPGHPHRLVIDIRASRAVGGLRYVPRPGAGAVGGRIKDYRMIVRERLALP
jgi:beta-galactosidase